MPLWKNEHLYLAFDNLIQKIEKWSSQKVFPILGFKSSVIFDRLIQRICELTFYPYSSICTSRNKNGKHPFPENGEIIQLAELSVDMNSGSVKISTKKFLLCVFEFLFHWVRFIFALFYRNFSGKEIENAATLVFGIDPEILTHEGNDKQFLKFCKESKIRPLSEAKQIIVQCRQKNIVSSQSLFVYTPNPLLYLLKHAQLDFKSRIRLLGKLLVLPFRCCVFFIQFPLLALLSYDIIQAIIVRQLEAKGLIKDVILTNSNFFEQTLWMRAHNSKNFKVHKVHYSQNTRPFVYKDDPFIGFFPPFRHVKVDTHWVWTEGYKNYMYELGHKGDVEVIGPILFYTPKSVDQRTDNEIRVAIFDVTPVYLEYSEKIGIIRNYYSSDNMFNFISGILESCKSLENETGKKVRFFLKSKRSFKNKIHDERYINYIHQLSETNPYFTLLEHSENLFSLIENCDISISYPYTSVPYVSSFLKKPAIYFDAGGELQETFERNPFIRGASSEKELKAVLRELLTT